MHNETQRASLRPSLVLYEPSWGELLAPAAERLVFYAAKILEATGAVCISRARLPSLLTEQTSNASTWERLAYKQNAYSELC